MRSNWQIHDLNNILYDKNFICFLTLFLRRSNYHALKTARSLVTLSFFLSKFLYEEKKLKANQKIFAIKRLDF